MAMERAGEGGPGPRPAVPARHALADQEALWAEVLKLAGAVEGAVTASVRALADGRADLADGVKLQERAIDDWEVRIERECLRILTIYEPVACDLRMLSAVLRINADLERISNLARNVAKRVAKLADDPGAFPVPEALDRMGQDVLALVRDGLGALTRTDPALSRAVVEGDGPIDRNYHEVLDVLKESIRRDPERLDTWLRLINTARNLERIADHAVKIAESVVYMKEGAIIRHPKDNPPPSRPSGG